MVHHTDPTRPRDDAGAYVGRLAPSPTGALHLGNARSFLIAWLRARSLGGRIVMRMEDLDHPKVKPETVEQVYEDLRWLGLDWDEGPDRGGPHAPYVQSQRLDHYREAFERLRRLNRVYACTCTRKDIEAMQSAPHSEAEMLYANLCRDRYADEQSARAESGRAPGWRFRAPVGESRFEDGFVGPQVEDLHHISGDFLVGRAGEAGGLGTAAYQLAVVVDDAAMGITEVVRADDLLVSTHRQLAIYEALGYDAPHFLHVPLVIGPDGRRLAKRHGDTRIRALREAGTPPEVVVGWLAESCGWREPGAAGEASKPGAGACLAADLIEGFTLEAIPRKPIVVDAATKARLGAPA